MEQNVDIAKRNNKKIFPIYKGLSWDLMFYYAIMFLFIVDVKGISAPMIMLAESLYTVFKIGLQIPFTILIEKMGNRNSLILGNIFIAIHMLMIILMKNPLELFIACFFCAAGYSIKGNCEPNLLFESTESKTEFSKIDSKGSTYWYAAEAVASVLAGFLYKANPYIPVIICLSLCIISIVVSFNFIELKELKEKKLEKKKTTFEQYRKELKEGVKYIINSQRLRALFLFGAVFVGITEMVSTYQKSLLKDLGMSSVYFGYITAILMLLSALSARMQGYIHKKFKNKALKYLSMPVFISFIVIGVLWILKIDNIIFIPIVISCFAIRRAAVSPFWTLNKRYLTSFTNESIRTKIFSSFTMIESISRSILAFIGSGLLAIMSAGTAYLIVGVVSLVGFLVIYDYMKPRFGLKPEEYSKKDIEFIELK